MITDEISYPEISPYLDNESDIYEELPPNDDSPLRIGYVKL